LLPPPQPTNSKEVIIDNFKPILILSPFDFFEDTYIKVEIDYNIYGVEDAKDPILNIWR